MCKKFYHSAEEVNRSQQDVFSLLWYSNIQCHTTRLIVRVVHG